jgi:hypothetical protein
VHTSPPDVPGRERRDRLELLTALIDGPGFDPLLRADIIEFPRDHPVWWWGCRIKDCPSSPPIGQVPRPYEAFESRGPASPVPETP